MAWSGGTYTRAITSLSVSGSGLWAAVKALAGHNTIRSDDHDLHDQDLATGINATLAKDGSNAATANLDLGGYRFTNAATSSTARTQLAPVAAIQDGAILWGGTSGGSADVQTITLTPAITAYASGQMFTFKAGYTNATATPTLNVNAVAAKTIVAPNGAALPAGAITANGIYTVVYDSGLDKLVLISRENPLMRRSAKTANYTVAAIDIGSEIDCTSGTFTLTLTAAATLGDGFYFAARNSGTDIITIDGNSSETIDGATTTVLLPGEAVLLLCDGSNWLTVAARRCEAYIVAVSDETTAITTGTAKITWRMPYAFRAVKASASVNTVSSSGTPTADVNANGSSIFGANKLSIDASEKTSETAATAVSFTVPYALAADDEMTIDIDTAGTGAKGLKVALLGWRN